MTAVIRLRVVWLALVAATAVSWILGSRHASGVDTTQAGVVVARLVAFVKVRDVGLEFMELREAPAALRWGFEGWVAVVGATLTVLYVVG